MATSRFLLVPLLLAAANAPLLTPSTAGAQAAAYAIVDNTTNHILEAHNANKKLQVGSLTKIATAMVVLDWAEAKGQDLGQMAVVPNSAMALTTTQGVGFRPGDQCSLRDLLYACLMQSDNQAAETLAAHVGRSLGAGKGKEVSAVDFFVAQMNALARKLGMERTRFTNPHGLDNLERTLPYSTAEDMARLASYAMTRSGFRFYVSQAERRITIQTVSGEPSSYLLKNTNELVGTDNIDGVKTGMTRKAGPCVVISAARAPESRQDGNTHIITPRRLNVVVLGSSDRFGLASQLMRKGWGLYDAWSAAGRPMKDTRSAKR